MNESFIEVFKVHDGVFCDTSYALERMHATSMKFFGERLSFTPHIGMLPNHLRKGVVKLRVVYGAEVESIEATTYDIRPLAGMNLVKAADIKYDFKYADRSQINALLGLKGKDDEILIEVDGLITDTSYSNVVFEDSTGLYTPASYLLNGTKRKKLLCEGRIAEKIITTNDISKYKMVYLINAMIDLEDQIGITTERIFI